MGTTFCGIFPPDSICLSKEPANEIKIKQSNLNHYCEQSVSKRLESRRRNSETFHNEKEEDSEDFKNKFRNFSLSASIQHYWNKRI